MRILDSLRTTLATLALVTLAVSPATAGDDPVLEPGDLIGSTAILGDLIQIDPATGVAAPLSTPTTGGPVTEIRFRQDGVLFATSGGGDSTLYTIDPISGVASVVGVHDFGAINGLEFVGGTLYGSYFAAGAPAEGPQPGVSLVIVDQTDASLTPLGPISGFGPVRGLAYDESNGVLYGVGLPAGPGPGVLGVVDSLLAIDLATGNPTEIGSLGIEIGGMSFGPDGLLYAGTVDGQLVVIDTTDASVTPIGPTGFQRLSGITFAPAGAPPVIEVPTASSLGLLVLCALLGLVAFRRIQARGSLPS